jgi:hypothetical protein
MTCNFFSQFENNFLDDEMNLQIVLSSKWRIAWLHGARFFPITTQFLAFVAKTMLKSAKIEGFYTFCLAEKSQLATLLSAWEQKSTEPPKNGTFTNSNISHFTNFQGISNNFKFPKIFGT